MQSMTGYGMTVFETAVGVCGLAWGPRGIVAVQLPEANADLTLARLKRRCPDANPRTPRPDIQRAIGEITALLAGERRDLGHIVLDMNDIAEFERRVYAIVRNIPPGSTLTYGEVAARLGDPRLAREVGAALGRNPFPIVVPCHRVLAANGRTGGFSAPGGVDTKMKMLSAERAQPGGPGLFDALPLARRPQPR
jgi:methylated-DNA-[protein]-cysteine S-methyltransferase